MERECGLFLLAVVTKIVDIRISPQFVMKYGFGLLFASLLTEMRKEKSRVD
ncbi:hypothetical protein [Bacillus sp. 2205SS5-2]|uniref:hypothetical protein n=1 Tax=Bacillus sp. 2205SS5-2 TaxID=3109031 RepID=UPI003005B7BC